VIFTADSATTNTFAGANLSEDEFNNVTFVSSSVSPVTFSFGTRSLRLGGILTVTDSSSTTTLSAGTNLNIQARTINVDVSGSIVFNGTGDFLSVVTLNIDGSLTMDTFVIGNIYMNRTAGTGTLDITAWTAWTVGVDVDVRWTFSPSVAGDTWQFVLEDVVAGGIYDLLRNAVIVDTQTAAGTMVTLSEVGGWAAGNAMAIDEGIAPPVNWLPFILSAFVSMGIIGWALSKEGI